MLELLEASRLPVDHEQILEWSLERPKLGGDRPQRSATYALELEGWVVGERLPVKAVDLRQDGRPVRRMLVNVERLDVAARFPHGRRARRCGFYATVNGLLFPTEFELSFEALFRDDSSFPLAMLRGRRERLQSDCRPQLQPLLVTMLGRTGSTVLLQMLAAHPQVVTYGPGINETRVASYWADVLITLSDPSSYLSQLAPGARLERGWSSRLEIVPRLEDRVTPEWVGSEGVRALATFCQSRIDALYKHVAAANGRSGAVYFAEKCQPAVGNPAPSLLSEIYPGLREIVLVRDFRDMVCSMMSYSAGPGARSFRADPEMTDEDFIRSWADSVGNLASNWRRRKHRAHLVRYEDLMLQPQRTVEALLAYLDLDRGDAVVASLVDALGETAPELRGHRTSPSYRASVGRWRRDLEPRLQRVAQETFSDALSLFGYDGAPAREEAPG